MNARQHAAWLQEGGGDELIDELLADRGLIAVPLGDTGGQMAGWFRKEVHHASDFAGMKVRIGGFAGKVLETLGATAVDPAKGWDSRGPVQGFAGCLRMGRSLRRRKVRRYWRGRRRLHFESRAVLLLSWMVEG